MDISLLLRVKQLICRKCRYSLAHLMESYRTPLRPRLERRLCNIYGEMEEECH